MVSIQGAAAYFLKQPGLDNLDPQRFVHKSGTLKKDLKSGSFHKHKEGIDKVYHYVQDTGTGRLRKDDEPYHMSSNFIPCAMATPLLLFSVLFFRVIKLAEIVFTCAFSVFQDFCVDKESERSIPVRFFLFTSDSLSKRQKELKELCETVQNDLCCACAMQIASLAAVYFGHFEKRELDITQMAVIFSEAELQWNEGRDMAKSLQSKLIKLLKDPDWREGLFEKLVEIRSSHNQGLSLYQCLYPLPEDYQQRIKWKEGEEYFSYEERVEAQESWKRERLAQIEGSGSSQLIEESKET